MELVVMVNHCFVAFHTQPDYREMIKKLVTESIYRVHLYYGDLSE